MHQVQKLVKYSVLSQSSDKERRFNTQHITAGRESTHLETENYFEQENSWSWKDFDKDRNSDFRSANIFTTVFVTCTFSVIAEINLDLQKQLETLQIYCTTKELEWKQKK